VRGEHGAVEVESADEAESDDEAEIAAALAAHEQVEVAWKDGEHWPGTLRDESRMNSTVLEYRFSVEPPLQGADSSLAACG